MNVNSNQNSLHSASASHACNFDGIIQADHSIGYTCAYCAGLDSTCAWETLQI